MGVKHDQSNRSIVQQELTDGLLEQIDVHLPFGPVAQTVALDVRIASCRYILPRLPLRGFVRSVARFNSAPRPQQPTSNHATVVLEPGFVSLISRGSYCPYGAGLA